LYGIVYVFLSVGARKFFVLCRIPLRDVVKLIIKKFSNVVKNKDQYIRSYEQKTSATSPTYTTLCM